MIVPALQDGNLSAGYRLFHVFKGLIALFSFKFLPYIFEV